MVQRLTQLLGLRSAGIEHDVKVKRLVVDSRLVKPGDLFVAIPGTHVDGRHYIADAVASGAVAVLTTPGAAQVDEISVPVVEHVDIRRAYAEMAAKFAGPQPERLVGVTGTNGKTSVADFARQIWLAMDVTAASVGTVGVLSDVYEAPGGLTTPDPGVLHGHLAVLKAKGVDHVALEASSHGLQQARLEALRFTAGGFTNLTRDHLDYHLTEETYLHAKARLISDLLVPGGAAVVMQSGAASDWITGLALGYRRHLISVGEAAWGAAQALSEDAVDLFIQRREITAHGQRLHVRIFGDMYELYLPLIGDFQAHNWLVAAGLVIGAGGDVARVMATAPQMRGVAGRMDYMGCLPNGAAVYVDYAHTPDGLQTVLAAARHHLPQTGRLHVVFGCGGDRDAGKRPIMGRVAANHADWVWITDDNPRNENPAGIRAEVVTGAASAKKLYEIADRAEAVERAMAHLTADDLLVVAGKGHETGQLIADQTLPYSDIETVENLLRAAGGSLARESIE